MQFKSRMYSNWPVTAMKSQDVYSLDEIVSLGKAGLGFKYTYIKLLSFVV